jgi:hypothetical protein
MPAMTAEMWLIVVVRVVGSLPVLRWPFYGALFAIAMDQVDLLLIQSVDLGGVDDYQTLDKFLDQAYMLTFLIVALRWEGYERGVSIGLYAFRFVGFVAFEITQQRTVLLFFPNLFELWFVLIAARYEFHLERRLVGRNLVRVSLALAALKIAQELAIHHFAVFDGFTMREAVEAIWDFVTP